MCLKPEINYIFLLLRVIYQYEKSMSESKLKLSIINNKILMQWYVIWCHSLVIFHLPTLLRCLFEELILHSHFSFVTKTLTESGQKQEVWKKKKERLENEILGYCILYSVHCILPTIFRSSINCMWCMFKSENHSHLSSPKQKPFFKLV